MTTKTMFSLQGSTREEVGVLYVESFGNPETRRMHPLIPNGQITVDDVRLDLRTWYGGVLSLAHAIGSDSPLPKWTEIDGLINKSFVDQVRGAIEKAA